MSEVEQILIGIDLGTSRTALMTNLGTKAMLASVVGYPRDLIGVKLLGAPRVVGDEALERRSYLDLYYPLEDGVLKEAGERDLEATTELIKHVVNIAKANATSPNPKVCGIIGVPARASSANKDHLLKMTQDILDISLVVSEPFMVGYGQDILLNSIIIDIGAGTTDICALKGKIPGNDDQVTLLKAGNFINEVLEAAIKQRYPEAQLTQHLVQTLKENHSFVGEAEEPIVVTLRCNGKPISFDITEEMKTACESVVLEIVEQVKNLLKGFDPEVQNDVLQNIVLAGGGARIKGLGQMIANLLTDFGDVSVSIVEDTDFAGSIGALKLATDLPPEYWSQLGDMIGA
ncbi:MAG: rod shape-determining protein [Gammaproteobacteria bacterium]|nr:rod shape-determining protein [Gammaproteobacteria bacterium]